MESSSSNHKGGEFNFNRKLWHMLGLIIPVAFYMDAFVWLSDWIASPTRTIGILLTGGGFLFLLLFDIVRFSFPPVNQLFLQYAGVLLKREEEHRINATVPYFFSLFILMSFCGFETVVLAAIYLMIGDPAAAYTGIRYGKHRFSNGKSLEGLLGFIAFSFLGAVAFLAFHALWTDESDMFFLYSRTFGINFQVILVILSGAIAAALGEFYSATGKYGFLDDNLYVPLAGAAGITISGLLLPGFPIDLLLFNPCTLFAGGFWPCG